MILSKFLINIAKPTAIGRSGSLSDNQSGYEPIVQALEFDQENCAGRCR